MRTRNVWFAGCVRRAGWILVLIGICLVPLAETAAQGCYFSDLQWSREGNGIFFLAGAGPDVRTLRFDLDSGRLDCLDPQVHEAAWAPLRGSVLFRDLFGIFEVHVDAGSNLNRPTMIALLPQASSQFLRAFGEDSRGQPLLWLYDRAQGAHAIVTLTPQGPIRLPGSLTGAEALRAWQERNRAVPFADAGSRYVRSTCVQRPQRTDRLCLENIARSRAGLSPVFRMTLGPPGGVQVLQNRCAPSGIAPARDSTRVVVGIFEEVDDAGTSDVLSCWVTDWKDGSRVFETLLPQPVDVRQRHRTSVHWLSRGQALWADVAGQLLLVDSRSRYASPLVPMPTRAVRSALHRVVVLEASERGPAQRAMQELRSAGLDAAIHDRGTVVELQLGAWIDRSAARERVDYLRQRGYREARASEGSVRDIAPSMGFGWVPGPRNQAVFIRNVDGTRGTFGEIWLVRGRSRPERIVASFEDVDLDRNPRR